MPPYLITVPNKPTECIEANSAGHALDEFVQSLGHASIAAAAAAAGQTRAEWLAAHPVRPVMEMD